VSKTYKDAQGDLWAEASRGFWMCTTSPCFDRTLEELEESFGPLTEVVEDGCSCPTVPGLGGELIRVPSVATVCSFCRGNYEPRPMTTQRVPKTPFAEIDWADIRAGEDKLFVTDDREQVALALFTSEVPDEVVNKAAASSGDDFPSNAFSVYSEAFNILLKKNADYGPSNIADSPGGPLNGILVRMWDKMSRLRHLVESGVEPENESLRDTLMDMANYSLIAMIVLDGNWPGMEEDK